MNEILLAVILSCLIVLSVLAIAVRINDKLDKILWLLRTMDGKDDDE